MTNTTWTGKKLKELAAELEAMPVINQDEEPVSKQAAVQTLAPQIRSLRTKGYSLELIANKLTERGLKISVETLRNYLSRGKGKKKGKKGPGLTPPVASESQMPATGRAPLPEPPAGERARTVTETKRTQTYTPGTFEPRPDREKL